VWTSEGGLFAEEENFTGTMEESYGNNYSETQTFGFNFNLEATFGPVGVYVGLDFNHAATQTAEKQVTATSTASFSMTSTVTPESTPPRDSAGDALPGFVNGYRFMSFYLRPKRSYFDTFFEQVVDPVWMRSTDPAAQALRAAQSHGNGVWRVMHRATYVSRIPPSLDRAPRQEEAPLLHKPVNEENNRVVIEAILAFTKPDGTPAVDPINPDVTAIGSAIEFLLAASLTDHPLYTPANLLIKSRYLPCWAPDVMFSTQTALQLDGTGYVNLANMGGGPTNKFTVETWLKAAACSGEQNLITYATSNQAQALVVSCGPTLKVKVNGSAWFDTGANFRDDLWHHLAITWDSSTGLLTVYKDGVALATTGTLAQGTSFIPAGTLVVGQQQTAPGTGFDATTGFVGIVDELRFWSDCLPSASLSTWMARPTTHGHPEYASLAAYMVFEGSFGSNEPMMSNASPREDATRVATTGCTSGGIAPLYVKAGAPIFNVDLYEEMREDLLHYLQRHFVKDE